MPYGIRSKLHETTRSGEKAEDSWLLSEGGRQFHSQWINPRNGVIEAIPRHQEIKEPLAKKILKNLNAE